MALSIQVNLSPALARLPEDLRARAASLRGARINTQIGRGVAQLFMDHFFMLDRTRANALGGERTHFYADAAKATSSAGDESGATVTVAQQGIRQRLEGGTIRAQNGKYLTIPARAEAYGRRAREFNNLKFVPLGPNRGMLVAGEMTGATGKLNEQGVVMYWLVPFVVQKKDASVLPGENLIRNRIAEVVQAAWNRQAGGLQ